MRGLHALCGLIAGTLTAACATVSASPAPPGSHTEKWIDLQAGQCVADLPPVDGSRVNVTVVDCATAHLAEVYLRAPMAVDAAIATVANRDCRNGLAPYTGQSVDSGRFSITYLIDSNQDRTGANPTPEHRHLPAAGRQRATVDRLRAPLRHDEAIQSLPGYE